MWNFPVFGATVVALLVEGRIGYPDALYRRIGHPVEWYGALIALLDRTLNRGSAGKAEGRIRGAVALAILLATAFVPAWLIAHGLHELSYGWIADALLATAFIAQHSLRQHVEKVATGLDASLDEGRAAVRHIVGRDPAALDATGVVRAALESLAENTSDGVVAPALCYALLGLPGIALYKAINTADSMIGHRSERYLHFGWAAARLDDLVNLPASRLTGFLFALATGERFRAVLEVMRRDAPKHQSPNAGWPEAAMAEALGVQFGGPRSYEGSTVDLPAMGSGRTELTRDDVAAGLRLFDRATTLLVLVMLAAAIVT